MTTEQHQHAAGSRVRLTVPGMDWQPARVPRSEKQKANNRLK